MMSILYSKKILTLYTKKIATYYAAIDGTFIRIYAQQTQAIN